MPETIRALTTDEAAVLELPEDRVTAFVEAWRTYAAPDAHTINMFAATSLEASDLADVLRELVAWRALAHDRLAIIETLAAQVAEPRWKVGDPDPTPNKMRSERYCNALNEDGTRLCTWGVGHPEPVHVSGNGLRIVAVWEVDTPMDPAPQGEPITAEND